MPGRRYATGNRCLGDKSRVLSGTAFGGTRTEMYASLPCRARFDDESPEHPPGVPGSTRGCDCVRGAKAHLVLRCFQNPGRSRRPRLPRSRSPRPQPRPLQSPVRCSATRWHVHPDVDLRQSGCAGPDHHRRIDHRGGALVNLPIPRPGRQPHIRPLKQSSTGSPLRTPRRWLHTRAGLTEQLR